MKIAVFTLVCLTTVLFSLTAMAQAATNVVSGGGGTPIVPLNMTTLWNTLIVVLIPIVVAGIKKVLPNIPTVAWPVGAALLGVLSNWLLAKAGAIPQSSWELGALCGAAAVGVREIADQSFGAAKQSFAKLTGGGLPPPPAGK